MSTISGDRNSVSFNLQKFEYKEGKIDKREMAKAVFKMAKEGDQEASAIVNQFKSVEGLYNAIKDKMGGAANAVENLFSNVPFNLFKPKFLSKNKWKINTKALKDYVAERRTLKRDEKTVSNEMQPNAPLPKVQTEQKVLSPEVKKEQSTPDQVQTPVIDTQPLDAAEAKSIQEMHASIKNHYHGLKNLRSQIGNDLMPKLVSLERNGYITLQKRRTIEQECRSLQGNISQQTDIVSGAIERPESPIQGRREGYNDAMIVPGQYNEAMKKSDDDVAIPDDKMGDVYRQMDFGKLDEAKAGIAKLRAKIDLLQPTPEQQEAKTAQYRDAWRAIQKQTPERIQKFEDLNKQYDALLQQLESCKNLTNPNDIKERDGWLRGININKENLQQSQEKLSKLDNLITSGLQQPVEFPKNYNQQIDNMNRDFPNQASRYEKDLEYLSSQVKALLQKATGTTDS